METELAGWGAWIRTPESRDSRLPSKLTRSVQFLRIKNWTVAANGACVLLRLGGLVGLSGTLPRWPCRHCGASVVTVPDAVATERIPNVSAENIQQANT